MDTATARQHEIAKRLECLITDWDSKFAEYRWSTSESRREILDFELRAIEGEKSELQYEFNYVAA